jgi:hypothetical protein
LSRKMVRHARAFMIHGLAPVDQLHVSAKEGCEPQHQAIYGGYSNARGATSLFAHELAFRINFRTRTIQQKPLLNSGAQARYDAAAPGEVFHYCGAKFHRLSKAEIIAICASGSFRMGLPVFS